MGTEVLEPLGVAALISAWNVPRATARIDRPFPVAFDPAALTRIR